MNYDIYIEDQYIVLDFKPPKIFITKWSRDERPEHPYQSLVFNQETNEWEVVWTKHSIYLRGLPRDKY